MEQKSEIYEHEVKNGLKSEENPNEVELTAEKAIVFIVEVILILSGIVAVFSAIWAKWTAFKVAVSVFLGIIAVVGVCEYFRTTVGKIFRKWQS